MLGNSFYTIEQTESDANNFCVTLVLNPSHDIYKVHFPGNPITPGVCLLQISLELLNNNFKRKLRLVEAKNIKYLKVINPLENPRIEFIIHCKSENDLIFADIRIVSGETVFTKINATYKGF
jgi:3-hydroxyacyl-[acyl-carrier-protein] dehydratase